MSDDQRPAWLPQLDLRALTRNSDRAFTRISVLHNTYRHVWIRAGLLTGLEIQASRRQWLGAFYDHGITDEGDDSAYAFHIAVVGLHVDVIHYGVTQLRGWIAAGAEDAERFKVPKTVPKLDAFEWCVRCTGDERHQVTEYTPAPDLELYKRLRGAEVLVEMGPVIPEAER